MSLPLAIQQSDPGSAIALFRLDATSVGGGVLFFVQSAESTIGLYFQGTYYVPVDVQFSDFEVTGQGQLPSPHIKLANTNQVFQAIVNEVGDLQGCELQRVRTFAQFLDDGATPDPSAFFGPDTFLVERKVSENPVYIEWELSAAIDQAGTMLPARVVVRDSCMWRYRIYTNGVFDYSRAQCPYTGGAYFDDLDQPTTPDKDLCSRQISGCKLRFGSDSSSPLPFGGFPGAARVGT